MTLEPTPEQRAVVRQPLHSFRVAAGAGTGKTTTVAMRVVALIEEHGIDPEQILGITFTNKAAGELAERISAALGTMVEPGREVEVHTYHGFAAQVLREYGALIGIERDTKLVTPTFARQILADVVQFAPIRVWDLANVHNIDRIAGFAGEMSDNLVEVGDIVPPAGAADDDTWAKRLDLLEVLRLYTAEKQRMGVADYGDLIAGAWRVVTTHRDVAAAIAERYRVVVLDEYQDTNPAQRELLRVLFAGRSPVMAVGDADQTIYEWRGASLENFAAFGKHFPNGLEPAPSLPLTTNRRSGRAILEVANHLRRRLDEHADELEAVAGTPEGVVRTAWFSNAAEEASWLASDIERLHDAGLAWRDCAILFRKNKDMQTIHDALAMHDIPYEVANLGGLLSVPEVADLFSWLRLLARAEDTTALARILIGSRYRLGLADLARLADWVRDRRANDDDDLDGLPDYTLIEGIDHLEDVAGLRPGARVALGQFRDEHQHLLRAAQGMSLVELCRTILDLTGAWQDVDAMSQAAGLSARLNLFRFLDLAESWSPLEGRPSLPAFTAYLDLMSDNPREELDTARVSEADAVTLITVHRAKGLEWEAVFLPATYADNFPSSYRGGDPYTSAEILPFEFRLDRHALPPIDAASDKDERAALLRDRHFASEWRLAYVAATRARQYLTVSGAWWYGHPTPKARPSKRSALYEVVAGLGDTVHDTPEVPPRPQRAEYRSRTDAPDPAFTDGWAGALRQGLADPIWPKSEAARRGVESEYDAAVAANQNRLFALPEPPPVLQSDEVVTSATGLVTYATCPKRYHWTTVDPLPRRGSAAARRGVEVHRRIELHNLGIVPLEAFGDASYDITSQGEEAAGSDPFAVFEQSRYATVTPLLTEAPFELVTRSGRVRGRIDAVYPLEGGWEVVDFKSGREQAAGANLVQLQTYALAVTEIDFGLPTPERIDVSFVYLGGDEVTVQSHPVDGDWIESAETTVTDLLTAIGQGRWQPEPSPACRRCDFLRFCPAGREFMESL